MSKEAFSGGESGVVLNSDRRKSHNHILSAYFQRSMLFILLIVFLCEGILGAAAGTLLDAPSPPRLVSYDSSAPQINIEWDMNALASSYTLYYTDKAATTTTASYSQTTDATVAGVVPCSASDGSPMDLELTVTAADGLESTKSAAVTMICAGLPESPADTRLILRSLDILLLEWEPPADNGGSPILGYAVYMRRTGEADYDLVYNGT